MHLDQPLTDKEFDELDQFLLSDRTPEDAMTMDILHGYLTAVVIGPEPVPMSEWLPRVWRESGSEPFSFANEKEAKRIVRLILRFMNEIAITFEVAPMEFEPLFCEMDENGRTFLEAEGWAVGFWEGINLRAEAWAPIWESEIAELMEPFYLLGSEAISEEEAPAIDTPEKREKLAFEIEANVPLIYRFWLPQRTSGVATERNAAPKVGRNDPCPCGSGKKSKKCCSQAAAADDE